MLISLSVQRRFLNEMCDEKINAMVYLLNGVKLEGYILNQDDTCIELFCPDKNDDSQIVFKHAIAGIMPSKKNNTGFDE